MGKENAISTGSVEKQIRHASIWRGFGSPESKLPDLLEQISTEIDSAWENEYFKFEGKPLEAQNFRNIVNEYNIGELSTAVVRTAIEWSKIPISDEDDKGEREKVRIGKNILGYYVLRRVVPAVDRVKEHYSAYSFDELDLIDFGMVQGLRILSEGPKALASRINTVVFNEGKRLLAERQAFPLSGIERGLNKDIPKFIREYVEENGDFPTLTEVKNAFAIGKDAFMKRFIENLIYGLDKEDIKSMEDMVEDEVVKNERLKEVNGAIESILSTRQQRIISLLYGLSVSREFSEEEVAKEFGLTTTRVRQVHSEALGKVRRYIKKRRNIRTLEPQFAEEKEEPRNVLMQGFDLSEQDYEVLGRTMIQDLDFPHYIYLNALRQNGFETLSDVLKKSAEELVVLDGIGAKTIYVIGDNLQEVLRPKKHYSEYPEHFIAKMITSPLRIPTEIQVESWEEHRNRIRKKGIEKEEGQKQQMKDVIKEAKAKGLSSTTEIQIFMVKKGTHPFGLASDSWMVGAMIEKILRDEQL